MTTLGDTSYQRRSHCECKRGNLILNGVPRDEESCLGHSEPSGEESRILGFTRERETGRKCFAKYDKKILLFLGKS